MQTLIVLIGQRQEQSMHRHVNAISLRDSPVPGHCLLCALHITPVGSVWPFRWEVISLCKGTRLGLPTQANLHNTLVK